MNKGNNKEQNKQKSNIGTKRTNSRIKLHPQEMNECGVIPKQYDLCVGIANIFCAPLWR